jgi:hypothetical protein
MHIFEVSFSMFHGCTRLWLVISNRQVCAPELRICPAAIGKPD